MPSYRTLTGDSFCLRVTLNRCFNNALNQTITLKLNHKMYKNENQIIGNNQNNKDNENFAYLRIRYCNHEYCSMNTLTKGDTKIRIIKYF